MTKAIRRERTFFDDNHRGYRGDYRKKGTKAVFSYFTGTGVEYRRATWAAPRTSGVEMWAIAPESIEVADD